MTPPTPPRGPADRPASAASQDGAITRRRLLQTGAAVGAGAALGAGASPAGAHEVEGIHVLLVSQTDGERPAGTDTGTEEIGFLASQLSRESGEHRANVDVVDDSLEDPDLEAFPSTFDDLHSYDAVVLNNVTGSPFDADQRAALEEFVGHGGGVVAIHAAATAHPDWAFYDDLLGARPTGRTAVQAAEVAVTDRVHPSTAHLPARWTVEDAWYDFDRSPRGDAHVLSTLDEDSYGSAATTDGRADHPIAWARETADDARIWYTGRGRTADAFLEDAFQEQLAQAILWVAGYAEGSGTATDWSAYEATELTTGVSNPTTVEFAPDGRLFVANQDGAIDVVNTRSGEATTVLDLPVFDAGESGALGLAFDPDFPDTGWCYVYYAPAEDALDPDADGPYNVLSRFTVESGGDGSGGDGTEGGAGVTIDPDSEVELLRVPVQRQSPYHFGGGVEFGPDGALYLSLGDNVTSADGYAPFDDATVPIDGDARATAGDTSDLRGSVLRIVPEDDGSYSVPEDNLFTAASGYGSEVDAGTVRPELYAVGFRNPYRIAVDPETGWLYVADQAPDALDWDAERGPPGIATLSQHREASVHGWPFVRAGHASVRPDGSGERYDPAGPTNESPNSDGLAQLPAVDGDDTLAFVATDWDAYTSPPAGGPWDAPAEPPHPELQDTSPIAGPLVRLDDPEIGGLPEYWDGKWLFWSWNAGDLHLATLDDDGDLLEVEPVLSDLDLESPTDAAVGPGGRLFVADWGQGFDGTDPAIHVIEHEPDAAPPPVDTEFELEGEVGGWHGVAPESIAGETNPALPVEAGADYRVRWTNADGVGHNFALRTADEEVIQASDVMGVLGETQTVHFTATEEMDHYICQPHQDLMRGDLDFGGGTDLQVDLGDPSDEATVRMGPDGDLQFAPAAVHLAVGGTVTWEVASGSHDTVAYHPDETGTERRIPEGAEPWSSGLLEAEGETVSVTFEEVGVYDYRCTPHESSGMVGTVVVGWPDPDDEPALSEPSSDVPDGAAEVLAALHEEVASTLEAGPELTIDGYEPRRPDGEDLFFDVDGDETVGQDDVVTFFRNQHRDAWQRPTLFDFSGNGSVGHGDVVKLFEYVATS